MNKTDLFRSAYAQARNIPRIHNPQTKRQQIRLLLATLKEALK